MHTLRDEDYLEPSSDERTARRVLALAIALTNTHSPLSSTELRRDLYPEMSRDAFKKAFQRDRTRLESAGIVVREAGKDGKQSLWRIDEASSFASEGALSPDDALALDFLLLPLASDPALPFARDLQLALTKIDRCFDGTSTASIPPEARRHNATLATIEACLAARHAIRVSYQRADGTTTQRVLAPYGMFHLRDSTYVVAARLPDRDDVGEVEPPHTYNLSRIRNVKELARRSYRIPVDFDVRDFIKLPFALGPIRYEATFLDPATGTTTSHGVNDEEVAASWAIAHGLRPTSPESLATAWRDRLQRFASMSHDASAFVSEGHGGSRRRRSFGARRAAGRAVRGSERIRELIALFGSLSRTGDSVSIEAISQRLGLTVEDARSLMDIVCSATGEVTSGLLISSNEDETEFTLQYPGVTGRPVRLTNAESIAVLHGLDLCGIPDDDPLRLRVQGAFLSPDLRLEDVRKALGLAEAPPNLLTCVWAQVEERIVAFDYRGIRDAAPRARRALVRQVRSHDGHWYLTGYDVDLGQDRTFRLDRMANLTLESVGRLPCNTGDSRELQVGITFATNEYYSVFHWPELHVLSQVNGVIQGNIPYYGPQSDWLPRRIAACDGTVVVDDERIMQAAREYAAGMLGSA